MSLSEILIQHFFGEFYDSVALGSNKTIIIMPCTDDVFYKPEI